MARQAFVLRHGSASTIGCLHLSTCTVERNAGCNEQYHVGSRFAPETKEDRPKLHQNVVTQQDRWNEAPRCCVQFNLIGNTAELISRLAYQSTGWV